MPIDPAFGEAFAHHLPPDFDESDPWSAHRVLGLPLRPFCLWHRFQLEVLESPILVPGQPIGLGDLRAAVAVCRTRWRENSRGPEFDPLLWWRVAGKGLRQHIALFDEYLRDFFQVPEVCLVSETEGKPAMPVGQPPETFRLAAEMIGWTKWPSRTVWELPIAEVNFYLKERERELLAGSATAQDWMTDEEREFQAKMREKQAKEKEAA